MRRALNIYRGGSTPVPVQYIQATGGIEITYGNRKIHIFETTANFTVTQGSTTEQLDVFVLGGGAGGGNGYGGIGGGGGGSGGYRLTQQLISAGVYPAGIGSGGLGSPANTPDTNGTNGQNSTFNGLTAVGGGGGNTVDNPTSNSGGSAGGAAWNGVSGSATSGQGNIGGICTRPTSIYGGGGGGADQPGTDSVPTGGGNGGDGILTAIAGVLAYYGGGGGGGGYDSVSQGFGGLGGGGRGGLGPSHPGANGVANMGAGGGGGIENDGPGGDGSEGIVVVSYQFMASCYPDLNNVSLTSYLIEVGTSGYSTFQSNNQKVVQNSNGIFVAYIRTADATYQNQTWRLKQSTDDGATFITLFDDDSHYSAPCIETDSENNLYIISPIGEFDSVFYKFLATDYTTPAVTTTLVGLSHDKYSMALDEANDRIYFTSNSNKFVALDLDGNIVTGPYTFTQDGPIAVAEYPNLQLDNVGNLYCGWTTHYTTNPGKLYWNISWLVSRDFGVTWEKADGTPITLPVVVDSTGPCDQITRYIEQGKDTWLSSFIFANDRLHALYYLHDDDGTYQQIYTRIHPTTGEVEIRTIQPLVCNPIIAGLDGFFIRDTWGSFMSPDTLRVITTTNNTDLVSGISTDNGVTWRRNKVINTNPPTGWRIYASCGFRQLVDGTKAYGVFTHQNPATNPITGSGDTYFIKMEI